MTPIVQILLEHKSVEEGEELQKWYHLAQDMQELEKQTTVIYEEAFEKYIQVTKSCHIQLVKLYSGEKTRTSKSKTGLTPRKSP